MTTDRQPDTDPKRFPHTSRDERNRLADKGIRPEASLRRWLRELRGGAPLSTDRESSVRVTDS